MKIELEFDEQMKAAVMEGRKCCTFRREKHGEVGDIFEVGGRRYRILQIKWARFADATAYYGAEGFENQTAMDEWGEKHYPVVDCRSPSGFVHFFAYVPREGEQ